MRLTSTTRSQLTQTTGENNLFKYILQHGFFAKGNLVTWWWSEPKNIVRGLGSSRNTHCLTLIRSLHATEDQDDKMTVIRIIRSRKLYLSIPMAGQRRVSLAPRVLITAVLEQIRFVCNSYKIISEYFSSISNCVCTSGLWQGGGGSPLPRLPLCRGQHLWDKRWGPKMMTLKLMQPWLKKKYFEKLMTTCCLLKTQLPCTIIIFVLF